MRPYVPSVRFNFELACQMRRQPDLAQLAPLHSFGVTAAAGASDHRLIAASIVSRRKGRMFSQLACGTGVHRTFHEANVFRDKRRHSVVFDTYIRIWRAGGQVAGCAGCAGCACSASGGARWGRWGCR